MTDSFIVIVFYSAFLSTSPGCLKLLFLGPNSIYTQIKLIHVKNRTVTKTALKFCTIFLRFIECKRDFRDFFLFIRISWSFCCLFSFHHRRFIFCEFFEKKKILMFGAWFAGAALCYCKLNWIFHICLQFMFIETLSRVSIFKNSNKIYSTNFKLNF
jgi:hypothetical protein